LLLLLGGLKSKGLTNHFKVYVGTEKINA
jgi:hypothetical protein